MITNGQIMNLQRRISTIELQAKGPQGSPRIQSLAQVCKELLDMVENLSGDVNRMKQK